MQLAYFDLVDMKLAAEWLLVLALASGAAGYVLAQALHALTEGLWSLLRRRGASAPFDQRVRDAQRRHVLMARLLQRRINREEQRLRAVPNLGSGT